MVNLGDLDAKAHAIDCNLSFIDTACHGADHGLFGTAFVRRLYPVRTKVSKNRGVLGENPADAR